ncbi:hypothetical protein [Cohnella silvisoli]|uniref:YhfM-like domain-containing protein n=1 Tax=Cohnella silvisoli TaxID=2873699 RepID=A0ABV1L1E0_9BACL|nr:hypothetical protein [Cohnella silvisoli]MCD9025458.1 hypothetical protein [Cohnella silvisoli]
MVEIKQLYILTAIIGFLIAGCMNQSSSIEIQKQIILINLKCNPSMNSKECNDKSYENEKDIQIFRNAFEKAETMSGDIDYGAEYILQLTYKDKTIKEYHLSLGTSRNSTGLLVDLINTNQGYEIPKKEANKLRDLIGN